MTRVLTARCACQHPIHGTPCEYGVNVNDVDRPCGCAPTCPLCRNHGFIVIRRGEGGDEKEAQDCPRGCVGWQR